MASTWIRRSTPSTTTSACALRWTNVGRGVRGKTAPHQALRPRHSMPFSSLGLSPELLRAVGESHYSAPTPVQIEAIPAILAGRDVWACAQPGRGNPAPFALPLLQNLQKIERDAPLLLHTL